MKNYSFLFLFAVLLLLSCGRHSRIDQYDYIPLKEYSFQPAEIDSGTAFRLLAFSGGKQDDKDNIYYYQFIGVNSKTGDTTRILTPLISFPSAEDPSGKIHTTPLQIDGSKQISEATYFKTDSLTNLMLQTFALPTDGKLDDKSDFGSMKNEIKSNQWVVVNKTMPIFFSPSYKTAIGILHFAEQPW